MLTPTQEDYIEAVYRRRQEGDSKGTTVTELAKELGCRLPTVTRTVRLLVAKHMVVHPARGRITLTERGRAVAEEIAHRHDDTVAFLEIILGLPADLARSEACRLEHSLSKMTAERVHRLMNYVEELPASERMKMRRAVQGRPNAAGAFTHLTEVKVAGWRR